MRCGSNTQQVPRPTRAMWVRAHRSTLLLVATTAPGADSICGAARALVLPDRGAMSTTMTSSHEAARSGPAGQSRPSGTPASSGGTVLAPPSEGRSWRALAASCAGQSGATLPGRASEASGSPGAGRRCQAATANAIGTATTAASRPTAPQTAAGGTAGQEAAGTRAAKWTAQSTLRGGPVKPWPVAQEARCPPSETMPTVANAVHMTPTMVRGSAASDAIPTFGPTALVTAAPPGRWWR